VLHEQLDSLYTQLTQVTLSTNNDIIKWRWTNNENFSTSSYYNWLDFKGVKVCRFNSTWRATLPLKIKVFLWLVQQNKILTKINLIKKSWQNNDHCVFCNYQESINHLFLHCFIATFLWLWLISYDNFSFHTNTILKLCQLDYRIPYNSIRSLGSKIIALAKCWCKLKGEGYIELL
jgi:zinc-binding in reverse transcriptase